MLPFPYRAGTTGEIRLRLPDHRADDGWAAKLVIKIDGTAQEVSLTGDGAEWTGTIAAADSASWKPGRWLAYVIASKDAEVHALLERRVDILPDPTAAEEPKSEIETELELVDEAIRAVLAGQGVQRYRIQTNIGQRELERMSLQDLRRHRGYLLERLANERSRQGRRKRGTWRRIGAKFTR